MTFTSGAIGIITFVFICTLFFAIGMILRRNEILIKCLHDEQTEGDVDSIKDLKGLISFNGVLLQLISILILGVLMFNMIALIFTK